MATGYSLGNRNDVEEDIQVIGETDPDVLTYSVSLPMSLSRMCRNDCPYCGYSKKDNIIVPYSTIRVAKEARANGAREVHFVTGERPDKYPHIRATLDLWGFESFVSYVYTVCELNFLEGLIPVIELGFLSPIEMKQLAEVSALAKIMLDTVDDNLAESLYKNSPGKKRDLRIKSLQWAGKLNFPVITGIMVGIGETKSNRKMNLQAIADLHAEYGHVHEVLIQNFMPAPKTPFETKKAAPQSELLHAYEMAKNILPDDIPVRVPIEMVSDVEPFIKLGMTDLGALTVQGHPPLLPGQEPIDFPALEALAEKLGYRLQQRFPLRKDFIFNNRYSKKLGQVFDNYKYKIKKEIQERQKEEKAT